MATKMNSYQTVHKLRNHPRRCFTIDAKVTSTEENGTVITVKVQEIGALPITYVVEFTGEFIETKDNFDNEMYLRTAAAIACSQIESLQYHSTRIKVNRESGLMETELLES